MPIIATFELRIPDIRIDARELVRVTSDAAVETISNSIRVGVESASGAPRGRKANGKPEGFNTGRLANGIRRTTITGSEARASTRIVPPADRAKYVAAKGDILTAGGRVGEAIDDATQTYLGGLK
jgi:hypothetical protein